MHPRGTPDLGWGDLAAALAWSLVARAAPAVGRDDGDDDDGGDEGDGGGSRLVALSVRSAFDLLLAELALPVGSEVAMSAVTIPDMARLVAAHGLVAVPVDLDLATLAPEAAALSAALTPRTRALIVAPLFGARPPLARALGTAALGAARGAGVLVIEDAAQAYAGGAPRRDPDADVSLFSFGPIKTATALGGAVACVADAELACRLRARQAGQPAASRGWLARRAARLALLKLLARPGAFGSFAAACRAAGTTHDEVIARAARGFPGGDLLAQLRRRPSPALARMVARRLGQEHAARLARRVERAELLERELRAAGVAPEHLPGRDARPHARWVFPLLSRDPEALVARLWRVGFDATRRGSSLAAVAAPPGRAAAEQARALVGSCVYLPSPAGMDDRALRRLARVVAAAEAGG